MAASLRRRCGPDTTSVQVFLPKGALVRSRGDFALSVLAGRLWITRTGDLDDTFVSAGERFDLAAADDALIEADQDARVALGSRGGEAGGEEPRFTIAPRLWTTA